jgi:hypothetical protein
MRSPVHQNQGFALPLTLILLAIAAATMVSVCTRSMALSAEAASAQHDLQRRWAMESCRREILPRAESLLHDAELHAKTPVTCRRYDLVLGGGRIELLVTDEQAKVKMDVLLARLGKTAAEQTLHTLLARRRADVRIDLNPDLDAVRQPPFPDAPMAGSFSQIFGNTPVSALLPQANRQGAGGHEMPADDLTCWGDGRINFRRASRQALVAATRGLLAEGQVQSIIKMRDDPDLTINALLQPLQLDAKSSGIVRALLTVRSACHGLWIIDTRGEAHATLFCVSDDNGAPGDESLEW